MWCRLCVAPVVYGIGCVCLGAESGMDGAQRHSTIDAKGWQEYGPAANLPSPQLSLCYPLVISGAGCSGSCHLHVVVASVLFIANPSGARRPIPGPCCNLNRVGVQLYPTFKLNFVGVQLYPTVVGAQLYPTCNLNFVGVQLYQTFNLILT